MAASRLSTPTHIAFIDRRGEAAIVSVYEWTPRSGDGLPKFGREVRHYETLSRGAAASARRSLKELAP